MKVGSEEGAGMTRRGGGQYVVSEEGWVREWEVGSTTTFVGLLEMVVQPYFGSTTGSGKGLCDCNFLDFLI